MSKKRRRKSTSKRPVPTQPRDTEVQSPVDLVSLASRPAPALAQLHTDGYAAGSQQFNLNIGGQVNAGGFSGTWSGMPIVFWCVELDQFFGFNNNYNYSHSLPDNGVFTLLGKLFHSAGGSALQDSTHSAAFQLAVWEIFYDSGNLNLLDGGLKVVGDNGNTAAVTLAQTWLAGLGSAIDDVNVFWLVNAGHQNFITNANLPPPPRITVPEPSGILLIVMAALAAAITLRRRARGILGLRSRLG